VQGENIMIFDVNRSNEVAMVMSETCRRGKIGITSGVFDMLHIGHLEYLKRCKENCDVLIVGVDSDTLVRERKGPGRPIITGEHRMLLVDALHMVDYVFPMNTVEEFYIATEKLFATDVFKNSDVIDGKKVRCFYGKLIILKDVNYFYSTSDVIQRIVDVYTR
jgi:cytidyltransferase-like protein